MTERTVVMEITPMEAAHLSALVVQFVELLDETDAASDDPALRRLTPDAYPDDAEASADFRSLTRDDLLDRRRDDARAVLTSLALDDLRSPGASGDGTADPSGLEPVVLLLDGDRVAAWLRTLAALRLVLASRLGISDEDDHDDADARFGVYDWLGYRLDGLVEAADPDRR